MKTIIYFKEKEEKEEKQGFFNSVITKYKETYVNIDHIVIEKRSSSGKYYIMLFTACNSLINEFALDGDINEVRIKRFYNLVQ